MTIKNYAYKVVWPRGKKRTEVVNLAKRLSGLENKTICTLWDWLFRGDKILDLLNEDLTKQYPGLKFIDHSKFGSLHGGDEGKTLAQ